MMDPNPIALRFPPNHLDHAGDRRFAEVGEVHRNLSASFDKQSQAFYITKSARRLADRLSDLLGDIHVAGGEIGIECDERIARANHCGSSSSQFGWTKIRRTLRIRSDLGFESFILPLADVFEIGSLRTC